MIMRITYGGSQPSLGPANFWTLQVDFRDIPRDKFVTVRARDLQTRTDLRFGSRLAVQRDPDQQGLLDTFGGKIESDDWKHKDVVYV